ncbi:hypothetical protein EQZ20_10150 [Bacillus glycinifermentans]|uniref:Uncharacterized protein n=1 Tax=Bacillus glycinifermentans TaxID=1664069 RepID=A0AAJ4D267_9BACI|nr:hypothetical protein [Bacillus glycinifermentans]QAT65248.1 hypothetical protein EQZ20_10150 [Bacillus glycinifermentans]
MILHNNQFQVTREQIKLLLLSPESSDLSKEWGSQEQVLDELAEGYIEYQQQYGGSINDYLEWYAELPCYH